MMSISLRAAADDSAEPDVFDEELVKEQLGLDVSTLMQYRDEIIDKTNALFASLNAA